MEKKYRLTIHFGHDEPDIAEVARILRDLSERIEADGLEYTDLRDVHGNIVGDAFIQERMI